MLLPTTSGSGSFLRLGASDATDTDTGNTYTIEYSYNFQRHVVRRSTKSRSNNNNNNNAVQLQPVPSSAAAAAVVLESFVWLDQALEQYPTAELMPLTCYTFHDATATELRVVPSNDTVVPWMVAGGGLDNCDNDENAPTSKHSYPVLQLPIGRNETDLAAAAAATATTDVPSQLQEIQGILESQLRWYPAQAKSLLDKVPGLRFVAPDQLRERLAFFLAPQGSPADNSNKNNNNNIVDWPRRFYCQGHGAGMSIAQLSHALEIVPHMLLPVQTATTTTTTTASLVQQTVVMCEQTPSVIWDIACQQCDLTGTAHADQAAVAYLHWKGWEWTVWRTLLAALPRTVTASTVPAWDWATNTSNSSKQSLPQQLRAPVLQYLQLRLQVGPAQIHAMFKTHGAAARYSLPHCRRTLNALQSLLQCQSAHVQAMILLMPSLLGASADSLRARQEFWTVKVGLTAQQLRQVCGKKPAVLQYSVDANLQPKLDFFADTLEIPETALVRLTCSHTELWGRSLERHLRPMSVSFADRVGLSPAEFGQMAVRAPELLLCHYENNLQVKLNFLQDRLGLEPDELKAMILATPRILMQSMEYSLQPKIGFLEQASASKGKEQQESRAVLKENPSLLLTSKTVLKDRLERALTASSENTTLSDLLDRSLAAKRARRKSKAVLLVTLSNPVQVKLEFPNVAAAAIHAGISKSNMYHVVRQGRSLQGKKYIYANTTTISMANPTPLLSSGERLPLTLNSPTISVTQPLDSTTVASSTGSISLVVCAAGRAYPPENAVRGRRRAGGLAFRVPTWTLNDWRKVCANLWTSQRMRLLSDGKTMVIAYQYTRPSRPRCSLYACREALRAASQWLEYQEEPHRTIDITIETDSNYVLDLLRNTSQVLEWGKAKTKDDFVYTGPLPVYQVNQDILYPLARIFYHLVQQDQPALATPVNESPLVRGHNVTVCFVHSNRDLSNRQVGKVALHAAQLTYDKIN